MSEELNALLAKIENDLHKKGILQKKCFTIFLLLLLHQHRKKSNKKF